MQGIELCLRVQIGLNKGEARNALSRAVFLNRLGAPSPNSGDGIRCTPTADPTPARPFARHSAGAGARSRRARLEPCTGSRLASVVEADTPRQASVEKWASSSRTSRG